MVLLVLWSSFFAHGDKYSYPEQKILAAGVESIQISGVKGQVKLKGRSGKAFRLKVRHSKSKKFEDWSLAVDRRDGVLYLEVSSIAYGAQWRKTVKRDLWPEFDIELSGPAKPVTVSWREGDLEFADWTADVESSNIKGRVYVHGGIGNYKIQTGESDVDVEKLAGDLSIQGESGKVLVDQVTGKLTLSWISGRVDIQNSAGGGKLELNNSDMKLASCAGEWSVNLAKGRAEIERCSGKLTAEGQSAAWKLRATRDLETEIKSASGPVAVKWGKGGAKVFLTTDNGQIAGSAVPPKVDDEGRKVAEFRIGAKPFSQVFVKTQSGAIQFAR